MKSNPSRVSMTRLGRRLPLVFFLSVVVLIAIFASTSFGQTTQTQGRSCANGRIELRTTAFGNITDGSPPLQASRPGSDCTWIIRPSVFTPALGISNDDGTVNNNNTSPSSDTPISATNTPSSQLLTLELSHWELNTATEDRIIVERIPPSGSHPANTTILATVRGFWQGQALRFSVSSTEASGIRLRFITDDEGVNFDGFFANWWVGETRPPGSCPYDCLGRGTCGVDGTCRCLRGYAGAGCHNDDLFHLTHLLDKCNGPSWRRRDNWNDTSIPICPRSTNSTTLSNSTSPPSNWFGITACESNRITELRLPFNNIECIKSPSRINTTITPTRPTTSLSSSLRPTTSPTPAPSPPIITASDLLLPVYLRVLDLTGNSLGAFPTSIASLTNLEHLHLASTKMSGRLPSRLAASSFPLTMFNVSDNALVGTLPVTAKWVEGLKVLDVRRNRLTGEVPDGVERMQGVALFNDNEFWCPTPSYPSIRPFSCTNVTITEISSNHTTVLGDLPLSILGTQFPSNITYLCGFSELTIQEFSESSEDDQPTLLLNSTESPQYSVLPQRHSNSTFTTTLITTPATRLSRTSITCNTPRRHQGPSNFTLYTTYPSNSTDPHLRPITAIAIPFVFTVNCPKNTYLAVNSFDKCLHCPKGGYCAGGNSLPVAAEGFYSSPIKELTFLECFNGKSCLGNDTCADGYQGVRCVFCSEGYVSSNGKCITCDSDSAFLAFLSIFIILAMPVWWLHRAIKMVSNTALANLMLFVQVIGLFQKYPIIWDADLGAVVNVMSVAVLNTDYLNLQCAFGMLYYARVVAVWALPVIIAGVIYFYIVAISYYKQLKEGVPMRETMERWKRYAVFAYLSFLSLLHIPLTDRAFRMFTCVTDENYGRHYLLSSPDVTCYDATWYIYKPIAIVLGIVYGAGIPVLFFTILFINRNHLELDTVKQRFGGLYNSYRRKLWFWGPFQILWSLSFMSLPVTFREHSTYLMFISVCLLYIYLFSIIYFRPFINPHNNNISTLGWITTVIFLFAGVIIGFLSKNPDDHFTIDITVLVMFYITITAMVHASFYEWVLMSGHKWRRKSQFMDRLMGTRIWKRVFPPAAEGEEKTVKIEEKGKESKSLKVAELEKTEIPDVSQPIALTDIQSAIPLNDVPSVNDNVPVTQDLPATSYEADRDDRLLLPSQDGVSPRSMPGIGLGLDAFRNFMAKPWVAGYTNSGWTGERRYEAFGEEEADISGLNLGREGKEEEEFVIE